MTKPGLTGRTIALLEARFSRDIATLVERLGGTPISAPAVREVPRLDDVETFVEAATRGRIAVAIFQTGVGAAVLFREADRRGRLAEVVAALGRATVACRGPKPLAVLSRLGVRPSIVTAKPHTTHELLQALAGVEMRDRGVLLVHYGERNAALADTLRASGARLEEVCPYVWALPEDTGPIESMIRAAVDHRVDAALFTNQVQCRHLFQIAAAMGLADALRASLNDAIVVGAVGPVAGDALRAAGVTPDVLPALPNMTSLITAVADYFELTDDA